MRREGRRGEEGRGAKEEGEREREKERKPHKPMSSLAQTKSNPPSLLWMVVFASRQLSELHLQRALESFNRSGIGSRILFSPGSHYLLTDANLLRVTTISSFPPLLTRGGGKRGKSPRMPLLKTHRGLHDGEMYVFVQTIYSTFSLYQKAPVSTIALAPFFGCLYRAPCSPFD